jgi:hypothetical protein
MIDGDVSLPGRYSVGVDRTTATGSHYTGQYHEEMKLLYENLETCPDNDLLFSSHSSSTCHNLTLNYRSLGLNFLRVGLILKPKYRYHTENF